MKLHFHRSHFHMYGVNSVDSKVRRNGWYELLFIAAVSVLVPLILAPGLWDGSHSFFVWPDAREQTYAWWQKLAQCWQQGYLPLWDANTFGGHSFVAEFQASALYPLTWLWLLLWARAGTISVAALEGFILLHFVIALSGMTRLLRDWGLGRVASAAGAIVFAMLGAVATRAPAQPNIFFGLCLLPWAIVLVNQHLVHAQVRYALLAGAVIGLQILSGHVQPAYHTSLIVAAFVFAYHSRSQPTQRAALATTVRSGFFIVLALLAVTGPQWLLSIQYLDDAYRWVSANAPIRPGHHVPYKVFAFKFIVAPSDWPSLLDPWRFRVGDANTLYFGTVSLWLVAWFFSSRARTTAISAWQKNGTWLIVIGVFGFIATLGHYTFLAAILRQIPLAGSIRELGRYVILFHLTACVAVACATEALMSSRRPSRWKRWQYWLTLIATVILLVYWLRDGSIMSAQAVFALALAVLTAAIFYLSGSGRAAAVSGLAGIIVTAILFTNLVTPDASAARPVIEAFARIPLLDRVEADYGRERIIIDDSTQLPRNYAEVHRLQTTLGYGATIYRPYFDFLSRDWSVDGEIYDLLNVGFVLTRKQLNLPLVATDTATGLRLYQRPGAYPRVFMTSQYGADPDLRRTPYTVLYYDDHIERFSIRAPKSEQAIVSEIAYPGWCARVNGKPVVIEKAVLGGRPTPLRAVQLDAGDNVIEFTYRPFSSLLFGCH